MTFDPKIPTAGNQTAWLHAFRFVPHHPDNHTHSLTYSQPDKMKTVRLKNLLYCTKLHTKYYFYIFVELLMRKKIKRWKYYRLAKIYLHRGFRHSELCFYITLTVHGISLLQYKLTPADLVIIS